jgi:ligand-binding sensor domain-containing protein/two-component sensor histidine kinase
MLNRFFAYILQLNTQRRILIAIALLLLCPAFLRAQDADNLDIEKVQAEGLPNESISAIVQDENGFLWFGTHDGLCRYNGYNFMAFRNLPGDANTLNNNAILGLCTQKNCLYIGNRAGLSRIDINSLKVTNFASPEPLQVFKLLPKNDTVLWVGTLTGLFEFNTKTLHWSKIVALSKYSTLGLGADGKGDLYVCTGKGFYKYNIRNGAIKYFYPQIPIFPSIDKTGGTITFGDPTMDAAGNLWMGTWGAGLVKFNTATERFAQWAHPTDDLHFVPFRIIMDLLFDSDQNLWIANKDGGLTIYKPAANKFVNYPIEWKSDTKISGSVDVLFRDVSGITWIGTENGIFKVDPHKPTLARTNLLLKTDSGIFASPQSPLTMFKYTSGEWWLGGYNGLFSYNPKTGLLDDIGKELGFPPESRVFNIVKDKAGNVWTNASRTLVKISPLKPGEKKLQATFYNWPAIQSMIYYLTVDAEGKIWVATHANGIYRFDPALNTFTSFPFDVKDRNGKLHEVRAFCEIGKDSILLAGEHIGLYLLHVGQRRLEKITWNVPGVDPDVSINNIFRTGKSVFIGTEFNGLWETNTKMRLPTVLTTNDGLPAMDINALAGDVKANIWALTPSGIAVIGAKNKITIYDKKDGIQNLNALNAIVTDSDGSVSFGTNGAIYTVMPSGVPKNLAAPRVMITNLRIFDKEYPLHQGETVNLDYNQNYFSLDYVALSYTQPRLNQYAYKMAGLDKKWNMAGPRRYVSYANLDEGTYTFYVKACNNEGVWNNIPAKLILVISPPFWHRWWFYSLCAILLLSAVFFIYQYNMNQFRVRLLLRDKIARDLHDDIGSTLSGINIFSKLALQRLNNDGSSSRDLLEKISQKSENTLDALSDIVWSINTKNDGLSNFLAKAREYLGELLEVREIAYKIEASAEMEHVKIGMDVRKEIYLIFKEAVYNAAKYAGCTCVNVTMARHKDTCTLTICDNGHGFNVSDIPPGNGIENMRHRAKKIGAAFEIESRTGEGTTINLRFHIPRFR